MNIKPTFVPAPSSFNLTNPSDAEEIADEALNKFFETAEHLKLKTFLVLGTCLGFHAVNGYIKDDDDLDLGILCNVLELYKFKDSLEESGFKFREIHEHNICFSYKDRIFVDIWWLFPIEVLPFLESFQKITYKGKQYNVPSPVEGYLKLQYNDWIIPCTEKRSGRYL